MHTARRSVKKVARRVITLDELKRDHRKAARMARSDHGVDVVDDQGKKIFSLWIPNKALG